MLQAVRNAFRLPDLRRRILFTFFILVIFRLGAHVPVPGVDAERLRALFQTNELLGLLDLFSGGAMSTFSVMAMGVYPYITASIVMQLLQPLIPQLEQLAKEGEQGRQKMNQYTHWLTVPLAALQAFASSSLMAQQGILANFGLKGATLIPTLSTVLTMTAGTMFAVWLGELIDEQGVGNGVSLIIFGGIVARVPQTVGAYLIAQDWGRLIILAVIMVVTVAAIVVVQEGQRRIPVQYGRRVLAMRGNRLRVAGGQSSWIPLRVNSAGMIPLIFAQSIMLLPGTIAGYFVYSNVEWLANVAQTISRVFNPNGWTYALLYFLMVIGFTYFYTDVIFRQQNLPETLQKQGGFIPGIRPGKRTEDYLNGVLQRITLVGAVFLGVVAILPWISSLITGTSAGQGTMLITSSGLLIVVGVVLDTMKQLEAQLLMRHYEGFIRRT
ncbi:MAG: preprotein translocase subunit SecY [Anaerolineae bacterium]|nr:preprotein translocase subunit SecY [Anaerolineae bacterium]